ncbi:hypothetical protein, partial [Lysinibacillus boronitolerans]|uniref:hypothetical protein n=1 Tax=Lysinibacillus boronitolerans TaxID=309788 RepID=UPI0005623535
KFNNMEKGKFNVESNQQFICTNYVGEDIHEKVNRLMTTDGAIEDDLNAQKVYTKRKDGVIDNYNVRADKWDMALDTLDQINRTKIAKAA